jgi:hypothetical protein
LRYVASLCADESDLDEDVVKILVDEVDPQTHAPAPDLIDELDL